MGAFYPPAQSLDPAQIALREGLKMGGILATIHLLLATIFQFVPIGALALLALMFLIMAWPLSFFLAAMKAARQTAQVLTGTITGIWTSIFAGLPALIINVVFAAITAERSLEAGEMMITNLNMSIIYTTEMYIISSAIMNIFLTLIGIGLGVGIGAWGGVRGRLQSPLLRSSHDGSFPPQQPPLSSPKDPSTRFPATPRH